MIRLKTVLKDKETSYQYDKVGNRISETTGNIIKNYQYNSKNQLINIFEKENNIDSNITTYTYDDNGNQIQEVKNNIVQVINTYNSKNELINNVKRTSP